MTRHAGPKEFLWLGMLTVVCVAQAPLPGYTEEVSTQPDQTLIPELELIKEEESVSIASRYEQPISQAPSNVYVITDEDIRQSGAPDLPTVLRRVPGIEVMQMTGADFNVSVRGDNQPAANKLLVLVDGRSIYVDAQATVYWKAIPVTLPEIKRIEVLKGPASVLYGFNAFDGIINIITKSPEEMKGTTLQFGGGTYGTISSAVIYANSHKNLGYRLSYGHDQNQQWRNRNALAYRDNKFNVQTEYALPEESKLSLSGGLVDANQFDGVVTDVSQQQIQPSFGYANAAYERPNLYVRAFWNSYYTDGFNATIATLAPFLQFTDQNFSTALRLRANTYNVETGHTINLSVSNRFTYGFNYRHNTLSSNIIDQFSRENRLGFFLQDEWKPTGQITLVGGLRYDLDTFINPTLSPRIALLYSPVPDHTFRGTFSVAYRPPTLIETHLDTFATVTLPPPNLSPPPTNVRGSENLKPEQIISYELGYQGWFLNHRLRARSALFFNHITQLINFTPTPVNDSGQADIYGGEVGAEFLVTRWLSGFANFSYQEIGQSFTDVIRRGGPRFKYNVGIRGEWENGVSGEAVWHYVGSATYPISQAFSQFEPFGAVPPSTLVDSYNLLNLRAAYKFWQQKAEAGYLRDAEVALSAFNALNDEHKEHPLGDTIGSRVMGWLTVRY